MNVTPGKTLAVDEAITRAKLNLMAVPSITLEDGEVTNSKVASGIAGSKISDIPLASLTAEVQNKFGFKNWTPNASFDNWGAASFTANGEICDKWFLDAGALSFTAEREPVALGDVAALGDSKYYLELITTTASGAVAPVIYFKVPNVRIFSGQNVTISARLKQFSGTVGDIKFFITQKFGTGGSPSVDVTTKSASVVADGNWTLRSGTIAVPSVASKTAGTNGDDELWIGLEVQAASLTFNLGVDNFQVELGDTATAFEGIQVKEWQGQPVDNSVCNAVLTLTTGVPIMTSSVTAATSVFITPYKGDRIALWGGKGWTLSRFKEQEISLSGFAADSVWDVFAYDNGGVVAFETLIWTSQTARATAITYQDGVLCKSGDKTRRYVGSFGTTSTIGQTEWVVGGSAAGGSRISLLVYSEYLSEKIKTSNVDTTSTWNVTSASWAQKNSGTSPNYNEATVLIGKETKYITVYNSTRNGTGFFYTPGFGLSTTVAIEEPMSFVGQNNAYVGGLSFNYRPGIGVYKIYALEKRENGGGTATQLGGSVNGFGIIIN
jgi:hypothetical protein